MKFILTEQSVEIPEGVTVDIKSRNVTVKGPLGEVKKSFKHVACDIFKRKNPKDTKKSQVQLQMWMANRKQKACVNSVASQIDNLFTGVTKGYKYKMRYAFAHFPIQAHVTPKGDAVEIRNFLGEKIIRRIDMLPGVVISRREEDKDTLVLKGTDLQNVSQTCSLIHQACLVRNKDIRMFLDGCYVSEKRLHYED